MRDLAIDPVTGDLALDAGQVHLTAGREAVAQRLYLRLGIWRGEYVFDRRVGLPYRAFLGRKGVQRSLEAILRRAIVTAPGVRSIERFPFRIERRVAIVNGLSVRMTTGELVDVPAFTSDEY
jgi:hypothetical protein